MKLSEFHRQLNAAGARWGPDAPVLLLIHCDTPDGEVEWEVEVESIDAKDAIIGIHGDLP
jgi:hypothetical protein